VTRVAPGHSPSTACRHTVSGTLSLPSQGCFSPFPHGTGSLSVASEYLALRDGPRSFPRDFPCPAVLRYPSRAGKGFAYRALTVSGRPFQVVRLPCRLVTRWPRGLTGPTTPVCKHTGLGCSAFARRYWRNHCCFLFLRVLRWFTSPRCPPRTYGFSPGYPRITGGGLPHSEIPGSKPVCGSPRLIAAYRVLRRLLAPRHSPYALSSLTVTLEPGSASPPLRPRPAAPEGPARHVRNRRPAAPHHECVRTHCVCVIRRLLPFAGYSVVKEPGGAPQAVGLGAPGNPRFTFRGSDTRTRQPGRPAGSPASRPDAGRPRLTRAKGGGEYRARTGDLLVANQALSQLS
jgi:hypothetical protein